MKTKEEKRALGRELQEKIYDVHDMEEGQAYSWDGCGTSGTDTCRLCGFQHEWGRGGQNSDDLDRYVTARGESLSLREAARVLCE